jgi:hypothetical protein
VHATVIAQVFIDKATLPGVALGWLADLDALTSMLIGSFYGRYVTLAGIPDDWPARVLSAIWPLDAGR